MDLSKTSAPQETKLHFLDYWRIIRIRKTVILAVFLLVVITATLVTFILPETFSSVARIRVERDQSDIPGVLQSATYGGAYDPFFINTEFELIQSEQILDPVIKKLNLATQWAAKAGNPSQPLSLERTRQILQGGINLQPVRNTSLIEIRVFSDKPEEAKLLANTIAEAYEQYRVDHRRKLTMGGVEALQKRWEEQEAKVREAQTNVDHLRLTLKVPDMIVNENTPASLMSGETLRRLEGLRIEGQRELVQQTTMLNKLLELKPEELKDTLPNVMQDSLMNSLLEQKNLAEQNLTAKEKDLGPMHVEVIKARALVEELQSKVDGKINGMVKSLQTRVAALQEGLRTLEAEVEKAMTNDILKAAQSQPYFEAKRELEERQRFRQLLSMKIYAEKTDNDLPKTAMVEVVQHAVVNPAAVSPKKTLNIVLGIVIGLVVGVGLAFFIEYLDTSVKTIDDVERSLGSPVLGVIPQNVGAILDEGAESPHAEAYRVLRTNLLFSRKDDKLNTVAIVSAGAGEGKSTTVFNLAAVFAQSGQRVLIVDSDLRRPTLHKMLRVSNHLGLTNYLLKQNTLEEVIQTTSLPTLDFMASGKLPSSSLGILSSTQMRDLINELKQHYDFVFFDSPPVMGVSDASILASEVDMTLQVIQYRRYPQPMNIRAKQLIEKVGGNLVGIVLNNINMSQDESYYYYSGYYHDYYSRDEDQEPAPAAGRPTQQS